MTSQFLFTDTNCSIPIEDLILIEGEVYYLNFTSFSELEKKHIIEDSPLSRFITYLPGNKTGSLKIDNYLGNVKIGDITFDVRSRKLSDQIPGSKQLKQLIDEIGSISNNINYKIDSPTTVLRDKDYHSYSKATTLSKFDYYYQLIFELPETNNLDSVLNKIFRNPHFNKKRKQVQSEISRVKNTNSSTLQSIFNAKNNYAYLPESSELNKCNLAQKIYKKTGKRLFPSQVESTITVTNYDTLENQFVKYFLNNIRITAYVIRSQFSSNEFIVKKANKIILWTDKILSNEFFQKIGELKIMPQNSSVLYYHPGYRELYDHFLSSLVPFRSIYDIATSHYFDHGLNNVASLYEIWTFLKVCQVVLGNEMYFDHLEPISENGNINYGFSVSNGKTLKVHYNKEFSGTSSETYSLRFRPDVTLEILSSHGKKYICFDAKYKFDISTRNHDLEPISRVKTEDIHKMHCYLDAIHDCFAAIVVYPGDKFVYYEKGSEYRVITDIASLNSKSGVGAINLTPESGFEALNSIVKVFLDAEKEVAE